MLPFSDSSLERMDRLGLSKEEVTELCEKVGYGDNITTTILLEAAERGLIGVKPNKDIWKIANDFVEDNLSKDFETNFSYLIDEFELIENEVSLLRKYIGEALDFKGMKVVLKRKIDKQENNG